MPLSGHQLINSQLMVNQFTGSSLAPMLTFQVYFTIEVDFVWKPGEKENRVVVHGGGGGVTTRQCHTLGYDTHDCHTTAKENIQNI